LVAVRRPLQALANTEGERDEARRHAEDLHPELRTAIETALKG